MEGSRRRLFIGSAAAMGGVLLGALPSRRAWAADPVVETHSGRLRGVTSDGAHVFRGVRYGAPTGGANRFRPPQPVEPWAGVREATAWGSSAPQTAQDQAPFYAWYTAIQPISEDCLFLNVFTPSVAGPARRPVMVWLHGGGWGACAGTAPGFNGADLARAEELVVVTVNHRLGAFGYLRLEDDDPRFAASGAAGMQDLVAALTWVRENIEAFGGDPRNVTIFGQSGGAAKVMTLMAMPAAKGLFHKAVVQSCSGGLRLDGPDEAARQSHDLARALGLPRADGAALQAVPMDRLVAAVGKVEDPFRPVLDGRILPHDPFYPGAPALAADIPLLIGNANTETSYYLRAEPANFDLDLPTVRRRLQAFLHIGATEVDGLLGAYRTSYPAFNPYELLLTLTTDYLFKRNTLKAASLQSGAARAPVFAYVFARETPIEGGRLHAPHTSEVPFIFGTTAAAAGQCGTGPDLASMTRRMQAAWGAFARHGNPGAPALPAWSPYNDAGRRTMVLKGESELARDPGGHARSALDGLPFYEYSTSRTAFVRG